MPDARPFEPIESDAQLLVRRLVEKQGLTQEEAKRTIEDYRKGRRVEIDPLLMEGLETI